jgi:hypothetical protein
MLLKTAPGKLGRRVIPGVSSIPEAEWSACYPDEAESWRYYRACETNKKAGVKIAAAEIHDEDGLLAAAPLFELAYPLDTQFQGAMRQVAGSVLKRFPSLTEWTLLGVGSPYAERCHVAVRDGLPQALRDRAVAALIETIEMEAWRRAASAIVYKDLQGKELRLLGGVLKSTRHVGVKSLPVAELEFGGGGEGDDLDGYLATLSRATRKDIRRKLRKSGAVRIERRTDIDGAAREIERLYSSTQAQSGVRYGHFDTLPESYFRSVASELGGSAVFFLYWVGRELAGFNLLLLEPDRVIDKYMGMRYPLAREHDLYVVSWIENVRFCLETGRRRLQTGQTAYEEKVRLGSRLQPSMLYVKHHNRAINQILRFAAPLAAFDRWDPHLRRLRKGRKLP